MRNIHWIQGDNLCESPLFRRNFFLEQMPLSAQIEICGLGYFQFYVNGKRIGDQEFMPAATNYSSILGNDTTYPVWEERSSYRTLYLDFDILQYLGTGENVLGFQLGNGWYHQTRRLDEGHFVFGFPKLRYELTIIQPDGTKRFLESDSETLWHPSELIGNNLFFGERHDLRLRQKDWCTAAADLSGWKPARPSHAPESQLVKQQCPADKVLRTIHPVLLKEEESRKLYDCGENIAGWASIRCAGKSGESVRVRYSEELDEKKYDLDFQSAGGDVQVQEDQYICDGTPAIVHPKFCWHAFRYFEVEGPGEAASVSVVCNDISVTSTFRCSDPVLNWLYDAYIRTQLDNYHNCIPTDCPHRERLGYTGDGQLTSETAMLTLGTKQLYEKWYQDILDSQGKDTGHIPHTAPFLGGGGGPGGWGCAVYVIPVNYYRVYGDPSLLQKGYPAIVRWLDYMHSRCKNGLVVREEEGGWCLGEWCAPASETQTIPEAFVNTCFYLQGLIELKEIAEILHLTTPAWADERIKESTDAVIRTYFNAETGDFCSGVGAANAFALNLGLGTPQTAQNLIDKYRTLGRMDTGIFGTPILLEQLFQQGEADLALRLLTNTSPVSFAHMMQSGATTLWETWEGTGSHNHPMFGSVVKLLFREILGIRQQKNTCGFRDYFIAPASISSLAWAEGSIQTEDKTISVKWTQEDGRMKITTRETAIKPGKQKH